MLLDCAGTGDAGRFVQLLVAELSVGKAQYHKLLCRLQEERAALQVGP